MSSKTKKAKQNQQYDNYWKLTVEYSDIFGVQFNGTLRMIVNFIDDHIDEINLLDSLKLKKGDKNEREKLTNLYVKLQEKVGAVYKKKDPGSTRKSINQFVKLGFIYPYLKGYHIDTKKFLNTDNDKVETKRNIFARIFYTNSSFNSSVTVDKSNIKQINFLLNTLLYHPLKMLSKNDIIGIMVTDLSSCKKGYLDSDELETQYNYAKTIHFEDNKYNQIHYMFNFLKQLPDLTANINDGVAFTEDDLIRPETVAERDPYLHHLYRKDLETESKSIYNDVVCFALKKHQKGLIASHLKPCSVCLKEKKPEEAYDYNNGLLLRADIDAYFDKNEISFDDEGNILFASFLSDEIKKQYEDCRLDNEILTPERLVYLKYHRDEFYKKNNISI